MTMIDNNGMSMSLIGPYSEAGYKNIIFSPNQWNPLPSTIWKTDTTKNGYKWNSDAGGGGARIDIRYASEMPMVFFWEDENKNRLLVWGAPQYHNGCAAFGFYSKGNKSILMKCGLTYVIPTTRLRIWSLQIPSKNGMVNGNGQRLERSEILTGLLIF